MHTYISLCISLYLSLSLCSSFSLSSPSPPSSFLPFFLYLYIRIYIFLSLFITTLVQYSIPVFFSFVALCIMRTAAGTDECTNGVANSRGSDWMRERADCKIAAASYNIHGGTNGIYIYIYIYHIVREKKQRMK